MFKDKDVICFFGDSITASGLWEAEVYQFLRKKYKIKCYNCGVSGGSARRAKGYLYSECLIYNPDYVVLMFGMNDCNIELYAEEQAEPETLEERREEFFRIHRESYEEIIQNCIKAGSEVIICLPTPYDEVRKHETKVIHYQKALEKAAEFQIEMAEKYNCFVVNFKDNMLPLLEYNEIIRADRVHPTEFGYHVMAQVFLKEIGEIEKCDFDTPFEFEEWNIKRREWEIKIHKLNYVELCDSYDDGYSKGKSVDEIKDIVRKKLENYKGDNEFICNAYTEYIEKGHLRLKYKGEIVKNTIF